MEIVIIDTPCDKEIYGDTSPYSEKGFELFKQWLCDNSVTFYAAPAEDFSIIEAYNKAEDEGNTKLLLENLS